MNPRRPRGLCCHDPDHLSHVHLAGRLRRRPRPGPRAPARRGRHGRPPMASRRHHRPGGRRGAYVMGRNMFGPIRGGWDEDWRGWWGDEPPYHAPVFVLTHHARDPIEMAGGTTFHFVTDGFDAAFEQATAVAEGRGVDIAGGASTVRQALSAGVIDELVLDIAPVLLGTGERLFDDVGDPRLVPVEVLHSPHATHIRYRAER